MQLPSVVRYEVAKDVEEVMEKDGSHVDHTTDFYSTSSSFLGGAGSFVQQKHQVAQHDIEEMRRNSIEEERAAAATAAAATP